jgi:uncharacterized protein YcaQ
MKTQTVSRKAARLFLLDALGLSRRSGSRSALDWVRLLQAVQIDPVARVGRNQDLAIMARDPQYPPLAVDALLDARAVFEYRANEQCILPMADYPYFAGVRQRMRQRLQNELARYRDTVCLVLGRIQNEGPLPSRAFASLTKVMGYWDTNTPGTKETSHVLNLLADSGLLVVVHREGVVRFFDVPERAIPDPVYDEARHIDIREADQGLFDAYFRAYRLVRGRHGRLGWSGCPLSERRQMLHERLTDGRVVAVSIQDVATPYYILVNDVDRLQAFQAAGREKSGPVAFLPPLDNLLWDRERLQDLFDFYYRWEVYVPPAKRAFGPYAMPILAGTHLVGRIDPELDRRTRCLIVHRLAWESSRSIGGRLEAAIFQSLNHWAERLGAMQVVVRAARP